MTQLELFEFLRQKIKHIQVQKAKPVLVAVNGIEGTGKTTLTEKLCDYLQSQYVNAIHVTIDGFHNPKAVRYAKGRDSALGYYHDAYNENAFVEHVLEASQSDCPHYVPAIHDLDSDEKLSLEPIFLQRDTVILTDGAYLFKNVYRPHWDLKIYLKTSFEIAQKRGIERDKLVLGGYESTKEKYLNRYHRASTIYIQENDPEACSDILIDNSDFQDLKVLKPE